MGKDFESWFHQWKPEGQFPNGKSLKLPFDIGMQNVGIPCAMPCTNVAPMGGAVPSYIFTEQSNFKGRQLKEPHGLYCLPQSRQGFMPDKNHHDRLMPENGFLGKVPNENNREVNASPTDCQRAPKQFLVFDRTGNKTTLILSSMFGTPNQPLNCWNQKKPMSHCNVSGRQLGNGSSALHSGPNLTYEFDDDNIISETHEDSEDIDALLSSDDEDSFTDDGEETSTGRSPSTMTAYEKQHWFDENEDMDEVASSAGPSKRQKLSDISYEVPSITYTSSSYKHKRTLEYEDDAESRCVGVPPTSNEYNNAYSLSGSKRERKEKIRETVNILQTILPDGNGKDAVVVLDEAINYLKTLKCTAKSLEVSGL